jgi:hypothetical protein
MRISFKSRYRRNRRHKYTDFLNDDAWEQRFNANALSKDAFNKIGVNKTKRRQNEEIIKDMADTFGVGWFCT